MFKNNNLLVNPSKKHSKGDNHPALVGWVFFIAKTNAYSVESYLINSRANFN